MEGVGAGGEGWVGGNGEGDGWGTGGGEGARRVSNCPEDAVVRLLGLWKTAVQTAANRVRWAGGGGPGTEGVRSSLRLTRWRSSRMGLATGV